MPRPYPPEPVSRPRERISLQRLQVGAYRANVAAVLAEGCELVLVHQQRVGGDHVDGPVVQGASSSPDT